MRSDDPIRFGVFELDPMRVLTLLVERAGDVVTREEIRERLWASESSFWRRRSEGEVPPAPDARARPPLGRDDALRAPSSVRLTEAPVLEDDFIERREVLVAPGQDRPVRFLGPLCLPDLYREVLAAPSASEAARRSPFGFDRAFAAIEWLYRAGYLERRDLDEL
jgi:hypothetical protein